MLPAPAPEAGFFPFPFPFPFSFPFPAAAPLSPPPRALSADLPFLTPARRPTPSDPAAQGFPGSHGPRNLWLAAIGEELVSAAHGEGTAVRLGRARLADGWGLGSAKTE